ncbi:hypothetical protein MPSI1_002085 [Malassezia psittaci]|uniref:Kinesin motor domain-containing protein n=1 Tax=Malassezia psittaci TaxID=1821823 RepID=A0AAF0JE81_9BASI|nr:hypothetical protein MPSI1_002085 [Malassezia psittaci]
METAAAAVGGRERPAGFVSMVDTAPAARPATPRAPFMPSPRKRAKGTPQRLRVPLQESEGNTMQHDSTPVLNKYRVSDHNTGVHRETQEGEKSYYSTDRETTPDTLHSNDPILESMQLSSPRGTPSAKVQDTDRSASHPTKFTRSLRDAVPGVHEPSIATTPRFRNATTRSNNPLNDKSYPRIRPQTAQQDVFAVESGSEVCSTASTSTAAKPSRVRPTGPRIAKPPVNVARPVTRVAFVDQIESGPRSTPHARAHSPVRATSPTRPVSPMRPVSAARSAQITRPGSPVRTTQPVRATSPIRAASSDWTTSNSASQTPRLRAKITKGISRQAQREAQSTSINSVPPLSGANRHPFTANQRVIGGNARQVPNSVMPPTREAPQAGERVDVQAVMQELGETSFALDDDDDHDQDTELQQGTDSVHVHIRLRPSESDEPCAWIATPETKTIMLDPMIAATKLQPNVGQPYKFDGLHTGTTNADVYATLARPLVRSVLQGYNAVVFAYGQTASGKTFTLSGSEDGQEPGIIPRAICDVFHGICQGSETREYLVRVSYLEIWNEVVRDLLDPSTHPQVRDDRRRGPNAVLVAPLQEQVVTSPSQVFDVLAQGEVNRHVGATDWNERSSRSHTCFKITVESWERASNAMQSDHLVGRHYRISELSLIDLAGSERHTWGVSRRTEGANINKSLLSLGKVIYALSERSAAERHDRAPRQQAAHVPFRDSKLTRILQNSLSGNARIAVVCTLNPDPAMVEESLGTLHFARRIKKVTVRAEQNEFDGDLSMLVGGPSAETQALLVRYRAEMGALRAKVAQLQKPVPNSEDSPPKTKVANAVQSAQTATSHLEKIPSSSDASSPLTLEAIQDRLQKLSTLILQGGQQLSTSNHREAHAVSPVKQRGFTFEDPLPLVQEKLHAALAKIARLERKLAARMSMPGAPHDSSKDAKIDALQRRIQELETVCAAQSVDPPPVLREEIRQEFRHELDQAAERIAERDAFLLEVTKECERLRCVNAELVRLAHQDTEKMVACLSQDSRPTQRPVMSLFAPHLRPATVLGHTSGPTSITPPAKSWDAPISIDGNDSDTLSTDDLDEVMESRDSLE